MSGLYDTDVALWAERQADALRRRASNEIDWDNVAEEIESLSRSDKREIRSRLAVVCAHFLKWHFQPDTRSNSCRGSVAESRNKIADLIDESRALKNHLYRVFAAAYDDGRCVAEAETGLTMPAACPWTVEQVLDHGFWPEAGQGNAA